MKGKLRALGLLAAFTAVLVLALAAPASASTVEECKAQIDNLIAATDAADFTSQNNAAQDEAGLIGKLENAKINLDQGKKREAIAKVRDYLGKVKRLGREGKLDADDAAELAAGAKAVIVCIRGID